MNEGFELRLPLDRIRDGDRVDLVADDEERRAIAQRLGLESIDRFEAHAMLSRDGEELRARGRIGASLQQRCVVTNEPVAAHVDEPFDIAFRPEPTVAEADDEVELGPEDCDVVFYDGNAIELGAAIADTLALSVDPYPRSASAEAALKEAGVLTEDQAGPFAALAALKKGLGSGE